MVINWIEWHAIRDLLGKSSLEVGAAGAVGVITVRNEPRGRK
jgi:hypothetical protein